MDDFYIRLKLYNEEEVSIIMQALNHYMYDNAHLTEEQWEIANRIMERLDRLI